MSGAIRRVICGMSGGVDSTVSALLLKRKKYEVIGVFMRNWDQRDETGFCNTDQDAEAAEDVCKRLEIPFKEVNLVKEYWSEVFTPLVAEYERGRTPNPDILCNSRIKFDHFHRVALEELGADAIATGHYARSSFGEDLEYSSPQKRVKLLKAADQVKDQTFFLSQVSEAALRRLMFPLGGLTKDIVKDIATRENFADVAARKESMGICFIGKRRNGFQSFISEYINPKPGEIRELESGKVIGEHQGVHLWTLGQNLRIPGQPMKIYVSDRDSETNVLTVVYGRDHPALYAENFFTSQPHWIDRQPDDLRHGDKSLTCQFRVQHSQPLVDGVVSLGMSSTQARNWEYMDQSSLIVSSARPLRAVTPGQFAVFYSGEECLGSAVIERQGPSLHLMKRPLDASMISD